jgi:uncharacterized protein involved in cysteine biosynthesis
MERIWNGFERKNRLNFVRELLNNLQNCDLILEAPGHSLIAILISLCPALHKNIICIASFKVFTRLLMKIQYFWGAVPC